MRPGILGVAAPTEPANTTAQSSTICSSGSMFRNDGHGSHAVDSPGYRTVLSATYLGWERIEASSIS